MNWASTPLSGLPASLDSSRLPWPGPGFLGSVLCHHFILPHFNRKALAIGLTADMIDLEIQDGAAHVNDNPLAFAHPWQPLVSRRDLLRVASIGVAGTLLPGWAKARPTHPTGKARSVILLWMAGGLTHIDSFDPKPDAPKEIRGTLGAIRTRLPGVQFCETMPCLAQQADRLALVRNFVAATDDHFLAQAFSLSGRRVPMGRITAEPNVGSVVAKLLGPRNGLPGYLAVPGTTRPGPPPVNLFTGGWLGREYAPFATGGQPSLRGAAGGPAGARAAG
jgi:hypothetical protein